MGGGPTLCNADYTVLVTGTGPFPNGQGGRYLENDNTSHLITQHLPVIITANNPLNPTGRNIRIINPTAAPGKYLNTEYAYIRQYIGEIWDEYESQVDLFLHLGMADGWEWYSVEERAYKEGFSSSFWGESAQESYYLDVDDVGRTWRDIGEAEGKGKWDALPMGLKPKKLDIGKVVAVAQEGVDKKLREDPSSHNATNQSAVIMAHEDAGPLGCGFIFYESLAQAWIRKSDVKVMFTHVPSWKDEESLKKGASAVCAIAASICAQVEK